jgi:hypothetical protein
MVPPSKNGTCAILCQSVGIAEVPEFQPYINKQPMFHCFFIYVFIFVVFVLCVMGMERHSKKGGEK